MIDQIAGLFPWATLTVLLCNALALIGAALEAGRRKANGEAPAAPDAFLCALWDPFGGRLIEHVYYTDTRRLYGSRFIDVCVRIARVTLPLGLVMIIATVALVASGGIV